jgi:hypothetical protein
MLLPLPDDPLLGVLLVPLLDDDPPLLGDDAPLLLGDDDAPLDAPLEPDLKWASHSCRETCPSLFLSTDEKLGVVLEPLDALLLGDDALELLGEVLEPLGEVLEPLGDALEPLEAPLPEEPLLAPEEPELCASEAPAIANSAAAVAVPTTFNNIENFLLGDWERTAAP